MSRGICCTAPPKSFDPCPIACGWRLDYTGYAVLRGHRRAARTASPTAMVAEFNGKTSAKALSTALSSRAKIAQQLSHPSPVVACILLVKWTIGAVYIGPLLRKPRRMTYLSPSSGALLALNGRAVFVIYYKSQWELPRRPSDIGYLDYAAAFPQL